VDLGNRPYSIILPRIIICTSVMPTNQIKKYSDNIDKFLYEKRSNTIKLNVLMENQILLVLIGAMLGWLGSIIFDPAIPGSIVFLLVIVTVVCFLLSCYNTRQTQDVLNLHRNHVEKLLGSTNEIIAEPDFDNINYSEYQAVCYRKLIKLVENAQKQIFVVPNPFRLGGICSWENKGRELYLKKIEEKIQTNPGFQYTRIQQIPKNSSEPLSKHFGTLATAHIKTLLKDKPEGVTLKYIDSDEISGFMVIDNTIFIKFVTGIDYEGEKVMVAITIQDNHYARNTIQEFCSRFCKVLSERSSSITRGFATDEC
jgi:hypothetical protein